MDPIGKEVRNFLRVETLLGKHRFYYGTQYKRKVRRRSQ
jgi:hypothetical protein